MYAYIYIYHEWKIHILVHRTMDERFMFYIYKKYINDYIGDGNSLVTKMPSVLVLLLLRIDLTSTVHHSGFLLYNTGLYNRTLERLTEI